MFKIIGADRKEYGPVTADQIRQWIRENRVNQQTMACREGSLDWVPLGKTSDFTLDFAGAQQPVVPSPTTGALPLHPLPATVSSADLILGAMAADKAFSIIDCFRRGWRLVVENLGLLAGASALVLLIMMGTNLIWYIGWLVSMIIQGPLLGGLYALFLKRMRNQPAKTGDAFAGFGPVFVQLLVTQVITSLLITLSATLFFVGFAIMVVGHQSIVATFFGGMLGFLGLLPPIYLSVAWMFALPLVIDKQLDFTEALSLSHKVVFHHWWRVFGLMLLGSIFASLGLVALIIGFLFTMPVCFAAWMYAYEDLFGGSANRA
jgi:hypothetical protein